MEQAALLSPGAPRGVDGPPTPGSPVLEGGAWGPHEAMACARGPLTASAVAE